jgi:hypothetical protein
MSLKSALTLTALAVALATTGCTSTGAKTDNANPNGSGAEAHPSAKAFDESLNDGTSSGTSFNAADEPVDGVRATNADQERAQNQYVK